MDTPRDYYKSRIEHFQHQKSNLDRRSKHFSILRLICFIALGISIYQCFVTIYLPAILVLTTLLFIFFLVLIKRHDAIQRQRDHVENMLYINNNELGVLNNAPSEFNFGELYFSTDSYFYDLDVFGEGSVYHLLNRTGTTIGSDALANCLKNPLIDTDKIQQQQQAVKELSQKNELRQEILAVAINQKGKLSDLKNLQAWASSSLSISKKWWKVAVIIAPLLFTTSLIYGLITDNYYPLSIIFVLNWGVCFFISRGINVIHNQVSGAAKLLNQYAQIFNIMAQEKFNNGLLSEIAAKSDEANKLLKKLSSIINLFDQRMNLLVAVFFNAIFFYDLLIVMQLESWKKNNGTKIDRWFSSIGEIETLNSLATFAFNNPQYCMPTITDSKLIIQATELAHPLISANKRVSNNVDFNINSKVILITGSNMSGKSTFLRTIGVNMLLARCGAPVCAQEFGFYPVSIYTSLRQSDSLQEETSFFYAELKKLSEIVNQLETGEKAIVLLDEVLKGTNSDDKTYGSQELIQRLKHFNSLSLIATHDISLGKMEGDSDGLIENYCFESIIENDELIFDYKLHKGIAVNKNATFLMKKMGIIKN